MSDQIGMPLFDTTHWQEHVELSRTGFITSTNAVLALFGITRHKEEGQLDDEQDRALNRLANNYWMAIRKLAELTEAP